MLLGVLIALLPGAVLASDQPMPENPGDARAAAWNRFADAVYALHERQIESRDVIPHERVGSYVDFPKFYKEVTYKDATDKRILSRIRWETRPPGNIHTMEVFVYDESGRLLRDYVVSYLLTHRNAPFVTLINLHGYADHAHGYRQFDASGEKLYEQCVVTRDGRETRIEIHDDEFPFAHEPPLEVMTTAEYKSCFDEVPVKLGRYADPS